MMQFKVVAGVHKDRDGKKHSKGDVVLSDSRLDLVFKGKFERLEEEVKAPSKPFVDPQPTKLNPVEQSPAEEDTDPTGPDEDVSEEEQDDAPEAPEEPKAPVKRVRRRVRKSSK